MSNFTKPEDIPRRWPTAAAIKRINSLLGVSEVRYSQDWEFEISDAERLLEYLDIYENTLRSEDDRFALMSVIIDAFEHSNLDPATWNRIRKHLKTEFEVHRYTIHYWCVMHESYFDKEVGNWWDVTLWMRELWSECYTN